MNYWPHTPERLFRKRVSVLKELFFQIKRSGMNEECLNCCLNPERQNPHTFSLNKLICIRDCFANTKNSKQSE